VSNLKFKELTPERKAFFKDRLNNNPELTPLRNKLLELGGLEIVPKFESDLSKILERGKEWNGSIETEIMRISRCHQNAGELWSLNPKKNKLVTGWALSKDGLWRQHSWVIINDKIIETTEIRIKYFGFELNQDEAEEFYCYNCWGESKFYS